MRQVVPVTDIPPPPRGARRGRQHKERRAAHGLGLQAVPGRPAEKLAPRPLAGEGKDLRAVAQDGCCQAFPIEMVPAELRIDAGHGLDQIGEAEAEGKHLTILLRSQQPRREPDSMERRPELVSWPGIVRSALRRDTADRSAAEDDGEVGGEDVRKYGHGDIIRSVRIDATSRAATRMDSTMPKNTSGTSGTKIIVSA